MKKITRRFRQFGITQIGLVADEKDFIQKMEKRGYHVVHTKIYGNQITGTCIYIRNLPPDVKAHAKTITSDIFKAGTGDTVHFEKFEKLK